MLKKICGVAESLNKKKSNTNKKLLKFVEFELSVENKIPKLLEDLISKNGNVKNNWNTTFVISEHVNKFSVAGETFVVNGLLEYAKFVSDLMLQYGLQTDEITDKNINVEFHCAQFDEQFDNVGNVISHPHPSFSVHCDDCGVVNYKVYTFICYITQNLNEGNFGIYDDGYGNVTDHSTKIINISDVSPCKVKCIMFCGKLNHNALPILSGERYAISFQIKKYGDN